MPRNARVVIPDCPHHVTQRGNNRQDVFFTDEDREVYLGMPAEQCERFGLSVEGYCLMTNRVHLVATPRRADSPAQAVGRRTCTTRATSTPCTVAAATCGKTGSSRARWTRRS